MLFRIKTCRAFLAKMNGKSFLVEFSPDNISQQGGFFKVRGPPRLARSGHYVRRSLAFPHGSLCRGRLRCADGCRVGHYVPHPFNKRTRGIVGVRIKTTRSQDVLDFDRCTKGRDNDDVVWRQFLPGHELFAG